MQNIRMAQRLKPTADRPRRRRPRAADVPAARRHATSRASRRSRGSTTSRRQLSGGQRQRVADRPRARQPPQARARRRADRGAGRQQRPGGRHAAAAPRPRSGPRRNCDRLVRPAEEAGENGRLAEWQIPLLKRSRDRDGDDEPDRHARRPHHEPGRPHRSHGARADRVERGGGRAAVRARRACGKARRSPRSCPRSSRRSPTNCWSASPGRCPCGRIKSRRTPAASRCSSRAQEIIRERRPGERAQQVLPDPPRHGGSVAAGTTAGRRRRWPRWGRAATSARWRS